jgi:hypothetical protein
MIPGSLTKGPRRHGHKAKSNHKIKTGRKARQQRYTEIYKKPPAEWTEQEHQFIDEVHRQAARGVAKRERLAQKIELRPEEERTEHQKRTLWSIQRKQYLRENKRRGETLLEHMQRIAEKPQHERSIIETKLARQYEKRQHKKQVIEMSWHRVDTHTPKKKKKQHAKPHGHHHNHHSNPRQPKASPTVLSVASLNTLMEKMSAMGLSSDKLKQSSAEPATAGASPWMPPSNTTGKSTHTFGV